MHRRYAWLHDLQITQNGYRKMMHGLAGFTHPLNGFKGLSGRETAKAVESGRLRLTPR
jgi:hypothetical protein